MKKGYFYFILILSILAISTFSIKISNALIDCSQCHTTEPGKSAIKAKDTIVINDSTCLKCHNPKYPPTPIGYNTHLVHIGKFSAKVDFLVRHPEITASFQCSDCHKQPDCRNCHVIGIPHIPPPVGDNCQGCHNQIDNLFRHPSQNLVIHNIFHLNSTKDCQMCHNPDSMKLLKLASGDTVPIGQAYNLCRQCHGTIFILWDNGQHYSNKTVPDDSEFADADDPAAAKADWETNWQNQNSCVNCHNPHNPSELYILPPITKPETTPTYIYAVPIIVIIMMIFLLKYGVKNFVGMILSAPKNISKFKLSKLKLPKLSIPISISLEEVEKTDSEIQINKIPEDIKHVDISDREVVNEKVVKEEKIDDNKDIYTSNKGANEEKMDEDINEESEDINEEKMDEDVDEDTSNKGKKFLKIFSKGDLLFVAGIIAMLAIFYIIFGAFMPIFVVLSESMSPHMERGDMIFYTDISRIDNINTFDTKNSESFGNYGEVIIYRPFGQDSVTPIIHRAMYYVNKGDPMWPGGPIAPTEGYITKGDNNPTYDQDFGASNLQPVKKEWIIGVARFRVPYIGYIRIWI